MPRVLWQIALVALRMFKNDAHGRNHVLLFSILSPGVLHVVNNMADEMSEDLPGYATWLPCFKAIVGFPSEEASGWSQCLQGTAFEGQAALLTKGSVPAAAKWRWGTVVRSLSKLIPLQKLLTAAWNPQMFLGKHAPSNLESDGGDNIELGEDEWNVMKLAPVVTDAMMRSTPSSGGRMPKCYSACMGLVTMSGHGQKAVRVMSTVAGA